MTKNEKGLMEVDGRFITVNDMIKCDTAWTEEIHHDFESYIKYDNNTSPKALIYRPFRVLKKE